MRDRSIRGAVPQRSPTFSSVGSCEFRKSVKNEGGGKVRRHKLFWVSLAVVGLLFFGTRAALAEDCGTANFPGSAINGVTGVCEVTSNSTVTVDTLTLGESVHVFPNVVINGTNVNGLTMNISAGGSPATPGDLTMDSGSAIMCNDPSLPTGADARQITINVAGKMLMASGSSITADNTIDGGNAGDITITVGTDMTMCGPNGGQTGCLATGTKRGRKGA